MAKMVWDTLATIFKASGPIGIINTRWEFFCTFAQEGENMEEHIKKLRGLQQTLHAMGELISDPGLGLFQYITDVTTKNLVEVHHGCRCRIADTDVRRPDRMDLGGIQIPTSWLRGHGA